MTPDERHEELLLAIATTQSRTLTGNDEFSLAVGIALAKLADIVRAQEAELARLRDHTHISGRGSILAIRSEGPQSEAEVWDDTFKQHQGWSEKQFIQMYGERPSP